ncbi:MAG: MFS transporter [Acidobacteria bacterium]|nr:MFS transporter [Acidobacteriota bacterium]
MSFVPRDGDAASSDVTFSSVAFSNATATFLLFGATSSLFGPLLISFSNRFHLSLPAAGAVLSIFFFGSLLGVPLGYLGIKKFRGNTVLSFMMVLMGAGAIDAALSRNWVQFLTGVFIMGLSFGGVDYSLNTLLVRTEPEHRGHRLSLANAGYGLGAVVGPALIILVRPNNFPLLYGVIAVAAVVLSTFNRGLIAPSPHNPAKHRGSLWAKGRRRSILLTFIVAYILYVAIETSTAGWIAPQLHREGYSQSLASVVTAGFWGGLAIGRVVGGPLAKRWSEEILVLGGLGLAVLLSLSAFFNGIAPFTYPLLGLIIASVYPMGLIWYTLLCPGDGDGLATLILFMMAGGIVGPAVESLMVSLVGIHVVPIVIATYALLDLGLFASALRYDRPAVSQD